MTTPPPPPPPREPSPRPATPTAPPGREPWWTGGRVAIAIVLVLVLTGGAGVVGFFAGVAVGGSDSFVDALDDAIAEGDLDVDVDDGSAGVPGFTPLDAAAEPGTPVGPGDSVTGELSGDAVDHPMVLDQTGEVSIEVTSTDFDTVLVLLDDAGELLDSDDDGAETGTDSRLDLELDAGTYTVRVQSWGSDGAGAYTLVVD